ncbi:MAG: NADH-quinone oxidoreductase subunit J, partial [Actinomycetota bacterium]|nr:NADH-quinone oxidoreductase subunit J [Actinomycetota bacterium]
MSGVGAGVSRLVGTLGLLAYNGAHNPHAEHLAVGADWAVYLVGAGMILAGALGVILLRNPVHCALFLVITLFGVALEFVDESADFLAAVQVIVYAGAIVILFLFVIMFLGVDRKDRVAKEPHPAQRPLAFALGLAVLILVLVLAGFGTWSTGAHSLSGPLYSGNGPADDVGRLGQTIYTRFLLPFEMTSALLVISIVAAVVLARGRHRVAAEMSGEEQAALRDGATPPGDAA